jgi:CRISPR/Cas system-associated endoribonuclease Cas2
MACYTRGMGRRRRTTNLTQSGMFDANTRLGTNQKKVLLILCAGIALAAQRTPGKQLQVLRDVAKEWKAIEPRALNRAVTRLYASKLIDRKTNSDGTDTFVLSDKGRKRVLRFDIRTIEIPHPQTWDGKWRLVLYDVPEEVRLLRAELSGVLKRLGFYELQKSVFIHPYECVDQVDFVIEAYDAREYVRHMVVERIDDSAPLIKHFKLKVGGTA